MSYYGTEREIIENLEKKITYWQDLAVANRKVAEGAQAQRDKDVSDALEQAAKVCDSDSGRHFLAIGIAQGEQAKHILGAKSACAMSLAAAIRAMKVEK